MNGKKKSVLMSAMSVFAVLLVIVLAVGLVFKYTKAGDIVKDWLNPAFRVEYNGIDYQNGDNAIILPKSGHARFIVKGVDSYKVRVVPNVTTETNFSYEIGNEVYLFGEADLSKYFVTADSIKNGYFIIDCSQDLSLESVLSKIHGGSKVVLNGNVKYPYLLSFGSDNVAITFMLGVLDGEDGATDITLSDEQIIF